MDITLSLAWICMINLSLFSIMLWSKKTNRKANRVLALLMLCFAYVHFEHILIYNHIMARFHYLNEIAVAVIFLLGPLYFQYVSYMTGIKINWKKYFYLHMLPFILPVYNFVKFLSESEEDIKLYFENAIIKQPQDATIWTSVAAIQMAFYLIWSVRLVNRYSATIKTETNNEILSLKWINAVTFALLVITFFLAPLLIALANNDSSAINIFYPVMTMLVYVTIFYKSINFPDAETEKKRIRGHVREKISRDMHDDLGSGLSKISFISNSLEENLKSDKNLRDQAGKISQISKDLVGNMNQIVWAVNPENDSLDSLISYLREYALDFLDECGLQCHINFPDSTGEIILLSEQRRNVFLVIKESLNNIVRHASAKQVWIEIIIQKNEICIHLKDDGKGFEIVNLQTGNGLKNMKYRMEQSGGKFNIESRLGNGTFTTISWPMRIKP